MPLSYQDKHTPRLQIIVINDAFMHYIGYLTRLNFLKVFKLVKLSKNKAFAHFLLFFLSVNVIILNIE